MALKKIIQQAWLHKDKVDQASMKEKFNAFVRMIPLVINGEYPAKKRNLILGLAATLYAICPLDFDYIPIIGWIDDFAVLAIGLKAIDKEIERFLQWEEEQKELLLS